MSNDPSSPTFLSAEEVAHIVAAACPPADYAGQRVLILVPDSTRSGPVGRIFKAIHAHLVGTAKCVDVMIALGTHPPLSLEEMRDRLGITANDVPRYQHVRLFNHTWQDPVMLREIGRLTCEDIHELSGGLFSFGVAVRINRILFNYDRILIVGPVFPHEVVGFSGGNKYLFPGVSGPEVLNFFHWLGAIITNPMIIGTKWTPVRRVVDRAAAMLPIPKTCFCMVVEKGELAGLYAGSPEEAWDVASNHSAQLHIVRKPQPFHTVLSCAPERYTDLWVAAKCMYKLEPVVADGGELILYAPHLSEISATHGERIRELGYHCRDYFLKQWDRFKEEPWGVIAHSTHLRGIGTYENGQEQCRIRVTLASQVPEEVCHSLNLGYLDPATINPDDYRDREEEGILYVSEAGEMLYHLEHRPDWAGGDA